MWLKAMIERCMKRARSGACASCDHKEACAAGRWQEAFAFAGAPAAAAPPAPGGGLLGLLRDFARNMQPRPARNAFRRQVEAKLEPLLPSGDVSVERVARELGCSRQTLYRRLKEEGVTFEQVLDALRRRLALRYLRQDGLSVKQVAYRLGFSDPAAFSRAFKRWTGHSPSQERP